MCRSTFTVSQINNNVRKRKSLFLFFKFTIDFRKKTTQSLKVIQRLTFCTQIFILKFKWVKIVLLAIYVGFQRKLQTKLVWLTGTVLLLTI